MTVADPVVCSKRDSDDGTRHNIAVDDPRADDDLAEPYNRDLWWINNPEERLDPRSPRLETVIVESAISELRIRPARTR